MYFTCECTLYFWIYILGKYVCAILWELENKFDNCGSGDSLIRE